MEEIHYIGKLNINIYSVVNPKILSDKVVITEERIQHIKAHHPENYERFVRYIPEIIANPDYIIEANKAFTAVILKEIEDNGERFKLILRLKMETDPSEYENSVLSFWRIGTTTWEKTLKNKVILYKRQ